MRAVTTTGQYRGLHPKCMCIGEGLEVLLTFESNEQKDGVLKHEEVNLHSSSFFLMATPLVMVILSKYERTKKTHIQLYLNINIVLRVYCTIVSSRPLRPKLLS